MSKRKLLQVKYLVPLGFVLVFFAVTAMGNDILAAFGSFRGIKTIEPDQLTELVDDQGAILLDVRQREEFEVSHIENAILVDDVDLTKMAPERPLLVYCTVGFRSTEWGATLTEMGFRNIYNLSGGIIRWKNEGRPVYNTNNQLTDSVHVYSDLFGFLLREGLAVD